MGNEWHTTLMLAESAWSAEDIITLIGLTVTILGGIVAVITIYQKCIKPRRTQTKLRKFFGLIERWFDTIDCHLETGLNMAQLQNMENKINDYLERHLKNHQIKFTQAMIRSWNKKIGLKTELLNSEEQFAQYSRMTCNPMPLWSYVNMLFGNFNNFQRLYREQSKDCNYAEVEMPVKFLRFYVEGR